MMRWFFGSEVERQSTLDRELSTTSSEVIDIRSGSTPDLETLTIRLERLETGMRLIVDTMKSAYGDIANSTRMLTYEVRNDRGPSNGGTNLQQSVASLNLMIDELLHSMRAFPHVLAAATDELSQRIEAMEARTTETLGELLGRSGSERAQATEVASAGT
jgi:hypothetical protein